MVEQADWVAIPRRRVKASKLPVALNNADRLIDWYFQNKPEVRRLAVFARDYKAFEQGVGTNSITLSDDGIKYRGFLIESMS